MISWSNKLQDRAGQLHSQFQNVLNLFYLTQACTCDPVDCATLGRVTAYQMRSGECLFQISILACNHHLKGICVILSVFGVLP